MTSAGTIYYNKTPPRACSPTTSSRTRTTFPCRTSPTTGMADRSEGLCCCPDTTGGAGPSSCTASKASTKRARATTARRRCRPKHAQRRFLGAARPREPVSDLQPVHPPRDRRRPLPAGSVCRQHHSARAHQSGREESSRVHREAADRRQLPTARATSRTRGCSKTIKYATNTIRVDHVITSKQRLYARTSWYDRNSNYNNYFSNLSTGEWFKFVSRQAAVDHVYVLSRATVLNLRYGYNWFVRGTDSNPANHGFDLTSLGFPASYNAAIPDDIRRFPRFNITGYQGTAIGGEERPEREPLIPGDPEQDRGRSLDEDRAGVPAVSRARQVLRQQSDRPVRLRRDVDTRSARQLSDRPGSARPVIRLVPARHPSAGTVVRAASYDEQSTTWGFYAQDDWRVGSRLTLNLGLRYEIETPLTERNNASVRGFDAAAVAADGGCRESRVCAESGGRDSGERNST